MASGYTDASSVPESHGPAMGAHSIYRKARRRLAEADAIWLSVGYDSYLFLPS